MYLLTVAPIGRGLPMDSLTYLSKTSLTPGALINVPLQKRTIPALVLTSVSAREAKADIKNAEFKLKQADNTTPIMELSPAFVEASAVMAERAACSLGAAIQALFPTLLLQEGIELARNPEITEADNELSPEEKTTPALPAIIQAESADRISTYKRVIRETFARGESIAYVLPTIQDIHRAEEAIARGIEDYTITLHSDLTKKQLRTKLEKVAHAEHPLLIITTPQFLATPTPKLAHIIMERESAAAYTMTHSPHLDLRHFVEAYARALNIPLLVGDLFLRIETLARAEIGELESFTRPKSRYASTGENHLVDLRTSGEQPAAHRVAFFSRELVALIKDARRRGASSFVFCVRRGIAPMTVCGDCGTVVHCETCEAPMVLHRKSGEPTPAAEVRGEPQDMSEEELSALGETLPGDIDAPAPSIKPTENIFMCHRCGTRTTPKHKCTSCGSWRMTTLGLGIAQAEEILRARFPDAPILRIDTDATPTTKAVLETARVFAETPGAILLGTEMAIPYLPAQIGVSAVLSVNSLLTAPDYRMNEHVFRLLLVLREKARDHFLIQTRDPLPIFNLAITGSLSEFIREEIDLRKELNFPPVTTLIKLTGDAKTVGVKNTLESIGQEAMNIVPGLLVAPVQSIRVGKRTVASMLLVLPVATWPNPDLRNFLMNLPRGITVQVDPKSIIN
jgi:primosomal protein N' (replication factor Y)